MVVVALLIQLNCYAIKIKNTDTTKKNFTMNDPLH